MPESHCEKQTPFVIFRRRPARERQEKCEWLNRCIQAAKVFHANMRKSCTIYDSWSRRNITNISPNLRSHACANYDGICSQWGSKRSYTLRNMLRVSCTLCTFCIVYRHPPTSACVSLVHIFTFEGVLFWDIFVVFVLLAHMCHFSLPT